MAVLRLAGARAAKSGLRLSKKAAMPSVASASPSEVHHVALQLELRFEAVVRRLPAQRLDAAHGARRPIDDARGQLDGLGLGTAGVGEPVHHAQRIEPACCDAVAREAELGEQQARNELRQEGGRAAIRAQADLDIGDREVGIARHHEHVAGQRDRHTRARRATFDGRDDRLAAIADGPDRIVQGLDALAPAGGRQLAPLGQLLQVATRAEEPGRAGEHRRTDAGIGVGLRQAGSQPFVEAGRDRVAGRGVVVDQYEHPAFSPDKDSIIHGHLRCRAPHSAPGDDLRLRADGRSSRAAWQSARAAVPGHADAAVHLDALLGHQRSHSSDRLLGGRKRPLAGQPVAFQHGGGIAGARGLLGGVLLRTG